MFPAALIQVARLAHIPATLGRWVKTFVPVLIYVATQPKGKPSSR